MPLYERLLITTRTPVFSKNAPAILHAAVPKRLARMTSEVRDVTALTIGISQACQLTQKACQVAAHNGSSCE